MKNLFIYLMLGLFLLSFTSAWTSSEFTRDEIKSLDKLTNFGTYEIKESAWYDPLKIFTEETIKSIELKTNTEQCVDCLSEGTIVLNKDGTLIDDLIWKRSFDEGKTFVDWKGYTNWKLLVEEDIDVFETTCIDGKEIIDEKNGTSYFEQDCVTSKTGTTKQWNVLDFKKEYKAGTYNYKIEGSKKASVTYDWIIKTNGELLTNWAVWGAVIGVGGVEANITINSPANNSIVYSKSVTINATANVTGGAYLTNASLNLSVNGGAWGVRNITDYGKIGGNGLVSYYKLDETSGTTAYDSLGINNGTNDGATINQIGKIDKAYSFDGTNDRVSLPINNAANDWTLSAWVKIESMTTRPTVSNAIFGSDLSTKYGTSVGVDTGKLYVEYNNGFVNYDYTWTLNNWYYITTVYDRTNGKITAYVNGTSLGDKSVTFGTSSYTNFHLGWADTSYNNWFDGTIDEAAIWNRTLTPTEITALYNSGAGSRPTTTTTTTTTFTNTFNAGDVVDFNYLFGDSDGDVGKSETRRFTIDGTAPTITLNYPTSLINYGAINGTLQLNFTATDSNLDKVWYNYNGTNVTIAGATSGVANLSNITLSSKKNVTIYANDTAGNINATTFSWDYKVFENGQNYSATSTETAVESFISNFTLQSGATLDSAYLNYNGTLYAAVISQDNGNYILTSNANIPANINSSLSQNNSFFWQFNYIGDTTFSLNTSALKQLVVPINLAVCGGSYTITALNFSLRNETIPLPYESSWSFGATFNYWAGNGLTSKNYTIQNTTVTNNILLCLANNTPVRINADINYFKSGFKERSYYFVNASVTNETNNITLWVAPSTDTSNIILHVTDEYLRPIKSGYVKAMRYYPGYNSYYNVVTGRTDDFGNANLDLIERTADYKFLILDSSGNLIYTTNPMKVICTTTPCTLEVVAGSIGGVLQDVETLNAISGYYTWNNATNYLTFTYNDATGLTSTMRLEVINVKPYGEVSICNTTVTGSSGIIPCLINQTTVSGDIIARTYRAASPEKPFKIYSFSLSNAWQNFGADGLLWVMLFTITMFIAGVIINPMTAGILTLVSVVFMMVTGFVYMPLTLAVSIIVVIIIYIAKMRG